jgi:hypothetical protein
VRMLPARLIGTVHTVSENRTLTAQSQRLTYANSVFPSTADFEVSLNELAAEGSNATGGQRQVRLLSVNR